MQFYSQSWIKHPLSLLFICCLYEHLFSNWSGNMPYVLDNGNYMVLFSTSMQTQCALVAWHSSSLTAALHSTLFNAHQNGVLTALFGCYMAGAMRNSCHHGVHSVFTPYNRAQVYTVTLLEATSVRCICVSCNLPPALLAEWSGSFLCYSGNTEVEPIPK